jgi:hypothetical protein
MLAVVSLVLAQSAVSLVLAQSVAAGVGAQSGGRPVECAPLEGGRASNVWERAKSPELQRYCDLLASGSAKLAGGSAMAGDVLVIADEADRALPGRAAPSVLRGRALERLGREPEGLAALREARTRDDRALDDPVALLAWARTLARTDHAREALDAYRSLLPRASALVIADRGPAYVEAGMLAMARGADGLDEAVAVLRQARRESQDVVQTLAIAALALALDRAGEKAEARATLGERAAGELRAALADARVRESLGPVGAPEADAMVGLALEPAEPARAREAWQRYAQGAGSKGPWLEHARAHLGVTGAGKGPGAKREGARSKER